MRSYSNTMKSRLKLYFVNDHLHICLIISLNNLKLPHNVSIAYVSDKLKSSFFTPLLIGDSFIDRKFKEPIADVEHIITCVFFATS